MSVPHRRPLVEDVATGGPGAEDVEVIIGDECGDGKIVSIGKVDDGTPPVLGSDSGKRTCLGSC